MVNFIKVFVLVLVLTSCGGNNNDLNSTIETGSTSPKDTVPTQVDSTNEATIDTIHYGIDISHFQGDILNLLSATDSIKFVICKATEGVTYIDPNFKMNWKSIKEKGLIRGAYHFYHDNDDPVKQARFFVEQLIGLDSSDITPVLDIEEGGLSEGVSIEKMQKDILVFLETVENLTGRKPILYTDYNFAMVNLSDPKLQNYDLWLAEYSKLPSPKIPTLWKNKGFKIWQKTARYVVDGDTSDFDIYYGPITDLVK